MDSEQRVLGSQKFSHSKSPAWYTFMRLLSKISVDKLPLAFREPSIMRPEDPISFGGFVKVRPANVRFVRGEENIHIAVKSARPAFASPNPDKLHANERDLNNAYREIATMRHPALINHANIVQLRAIDTEEFLIGAEENLFLLVEFAEKGTLDSYLQQCNVDLDTKVQFCTDTARGLAALHCAGILHNDVKADNVLIFRHDANHSGLVAKVSDFGCCVSLESKTATPGHLFWACPELSQRVQPTVQWDVYSYGFIVLCCAVTRNPFSYMTEKRMTSMKHNTIIY
ncbi:kinase-like domain-containing protein [Aspergillus novoparasiticus]|uniref:Kinase-like domain-containing protein n=1 Tax=Aspergillus novoparasiticus TaxID=986946 RepID=A0A5N6E644_9EURO|nr:kinase-like domain-containing protein [Aspergillus novoparasiticus]